MVGMWPGHMWDASGDVRLAPGVSFSMLEGGLFFQLCSSLLFTKMNSRVQDAAQTGHKRQATKTGRHVVTQGLPVFAASSTSPSPRETSS